MQFGEHTKAVEVVLDFVRTGQICHCRDAKNLPMHSWVRDLEKAMACAWETPYGSGESGYLWTDIRENEVGRIKGIARSMGNLPAIRASLSEVSNELFGIIGKGLPERLHPLRDDIFADLSHILLSRAVQGATDVFFEEMFSIYQAGGWPCGWVGDYPMGSVLAYCPCDIP
jgi:hypothetical protein